ncbi:helix-turn-helix domain-containing protein [Streptomyces bugieae]|uniref:Helix-turn-helix transcriptional regulator n=1 Tax=Streptomyces bugieae TaxID=3098223 RepID=A0ABU7NGL6_9ACTN|nr:helix-turn-helix transcriptional regulator [Streptomyces sp. DSM 41528]
MGRWQPLRDDLPAEVARLVRELRQYVDRCEMTTATVAAKTGYSRSSWLRYLNGRRMPPWSPVSGLGRLAQADAEYLRVLWESAAHAGKEEGPAGESGPPPVPRDPAERPQGSDTPTGRPPGAGEQAAGAWILTARGAIATASSSTACARTAAS